MVAPCQWGCVVPPLLAADVSMMSSFVAVAIVLGAVVPQVETKLAPATTTMATMNEMHHGAPSTMPSDPRPREGKGKGYEDVGGRHCHGRWW